MGPRPIQQGETLYGRDAELRELHDLLQARRIVLLHSPSGAGKSSLVHAGLIPRLKSAGYDVWKPIRVNLDPSELDVPASTNRYLLSAMVSLEDELPEHLRQSPAQLAELDLLDYLDKRPRRKQLANRHVVLLFDQFEEVLTVAPQAAEAKREFFSVLGRALDSGKYWALFIIREDYLGALAPYRELLPTQLANSFRLDLLGRAGAAEVAVKLAEQGGRSFPGVDYLIDDLAAVKVQQPDGSFETVPGLHVEPVQLQVVCRRLWAAMPADDRSIDVDNIAKYGEVSKSLASYYADAVRKVADGDRTVERAVREWVGEQLIVGGIRSQVRQELGSSAGLDNALIQQLVDSFLVRSEQRAGGTWFELSHDRLVEPVTHDNEAWEQANLHPLQVQARLWENGRRNPGLLLSAETLAEAEAWARDNDELVTASEREFMHASRESWLADMAARRRLRVATAVAVLVALVVAVLGIIAMVERGRAVAAKYVAEHARQAAEDATKAAEQAKTEAERAQAEAYRFSLMSSAADLLSRDEVGAAAMVLSAIDDPSEVRGWAKLAADILSRDTAHSTFEHDHVVRSAAWSPDGRRILTASGDRSVRIWSADGLGDPIVLSGHTDEVVQARFSPDGTRVVSASKDGSARVWSADGSGTPRVLGGHTDKLVDVDWSPDGKHIVTASKDGSARVWQAERDEPPRVLDGHDAELTSCVFSPTGRHIVTTSKDGTARVWSTDGAGEPIVLRGHTDGVLSARWSHGGHRIVTASEDDTARVWSADGSGQVIELAGHEGAVLSVSWSGDDRYIATGSADQTARIWSADGSGEPIDLVGHSGWIMAVAWSGDGRLATVSNDATTCIWSAMGAEKPLLLRGHRKDVVAVDWSPDRKRIVTASSDRSARIWETDSSEKPFSVLEGHQGWVLSAAWSPDGQKIVTAVVGGRGKRDAVRIWQADGSGSSRVFPGHDGWIYMAAWGPESARIVTASDDRTARIWTAADGRELAVLRGHQGPVRAATFSPDGQLVVTASDDKTVKIWSAEGGPALRELLGHEGPVSYAAFSPDGARVVTTSADHSVKIWNADGSGTPLTLTGHTDWVMSAGWSPDGTQIVTGSKDNTARIWNADGSGEARVLSGHEDFVLSVAWSPDGRHVVSASDDGSARVWPVGEGHDIVLSGHDGRVMDAGWAPDSLHVVTASLDRTVRIWQLQRYLDVEQLRRDLFDITTDCLSIEERQHHMFEDLAQAQAGFAQCEQQYGRTP